MTIRRKIEKCGIQNGEFVSIQALAWWFTLFWVCGPSGAIFLLNPAVLFSLFLLR
jgi:hypothetical protein